MAATLTAADRHPGRPRLHQPHGVLRRAGLQLGLDVIEVGLPGLGEEGLEVPLPEHKVLVERLAARRTDRPDADQHAVGVIQLGIIPVGINLAVLEDARAFGSHGGADDFGVRILGPPWLRRIFKCRGWRGGAQRDGSSDERPPHCRYCSALTAARVLATCWLKSRSSCSMATLPFLPMT